MKKIKVLIIGAGGIGGLNEFDKYRIRPCTHFGAFSKDKYFEVVGIVDSNYFKAKEFGKIFKISFFKSVMSALEKTRPNLVTIAVPFHSHHKIVSQCAKSPYKPSSIFCEKPISNNIQNARKIINTCKKNKIKLFVNNRRLETVYQKLNNIIKRQFNNKIISIHGYCSSGIHTIGSHMLDLMRYICGDAKFVISTRDRKKISKLPYSKNYKNSDPKIHSLIKFKSGVEGTFLCTAKTKYTYFEIEVLCESGKVRISDNGNKIEIWKMIRPSKSTLSYRLHNFNLKFKKSALFQNISSHIKKSLIKGNKNNILSGTEGFQTYSLMYALIVSSKKEKKIYVF